MIQQPAESVIFDYVTTYSSKSIKHIRTYGGFRYENTGQLDK